MSSYDPNVWIAWLTLGLLLAAGLQVLAAFKQAGAAKKQAQSAESQAESAANLLRVEEQLTKLSQQQLELQRLVEEPKTKVDVRVRLKRIPKAQRSMDWIGIEVGNMCAFGVWIEEATMHFAFPDIGPVATVILDLDQLAHPYSVVSDNGNVMKALRKHLQKNPDRQKVPIGTITLRVHFVSPNGPGYSDSPLYDVQADLGFLFKLEKR